MIRRHLGTALCLVLATVVLLHTPLRDRRHDRVVSGDVGDTVSSRELRVEVHGVKLTKTLVEAGERVTSPGTFVVVDLTAEALRQPASVDATVLATGPDREYNPSERADGGSLVASLTTGFPQHGVLVFELPRDAIRGSVLRIRDHTTLELPVFLDFRLGDPGEVPAVTLKPRTDPAEVERSYR